LLANHTGKFGEFHFARFSDFGESSPFFGQESAWRCGAIVADCRFAKDEKDGKDEKTCETTTRNW
jgi:hypothetical protein